MRAIGMHSTASRTVSVSRRLVSHKVAFAKPPSQRVSVKARAEGEATASFDITKQSEGDDIYALPRNQSPDAAYEGEHVLAGKGDSGGQRSSGGQRGSSEWSVGKQDTVIDESQRGTAVSLQDHTVPGSQGQHSSPQHGAPSDGLQPDEFPPQKPTGQQQGAPQPQSAQQYEAEVKGEFGLHGQYAAQQREAQQGGQGPRNDMESKIQAFRRLNQYMDTLHDELDTFMDIFLPGLGSDRSFSPTMVSELLRGVPDELLPADGAVLSGGIRPGRKALEMEVHETDMEYALTANVPGYTKDEIKITLAANNVLTVAGEQEWDQLASVGDEDGAQRQRRRWQASQSFVRCLWLPQNVDTNKLSATVENGVLTLKVPKKHAEKPETAAKLITVF